MFDRMREALNAAIDAATRPETRREAIHRMRETLVHAKVAIGELRDGVTATRARLEKERRELETIRRRKDLAAGIGDTETVTIAERFEQQHAERVSILERKLAVQEDELASAEREVEEMSGEMRRAVSGAAPATGSVRGGMDESDPLAPSASANDDPLDSDSALAGDIDRLSRQQRRTNAEREAEERLAALKRQLGKD